MRAVLLAMSIVALSGELSVQQWMEHGFYPVLLGILIIASLGLPIPEDIPLIAAGVLLRTQPGIASWPGTIAVALIGIMSGDLVLYSLGRFWGPGVVTHRYVRWLLTPARFTRMSRQFHVHGVWMVFFGRFFMGIRAAMCLTAGATHYPYWRFFLADFSGGLLSVPLFVFLGYCFADMLPVLQRYVGGVQALLLVAVAIAVLIGIMIWRGRRRARAARLRSAHTPKIGPAPGLRS